MVSVKEKETKSKKSAAVTSDEKPKKVKSESKTKSTSSKVPADVKEKVSKPSKDKALVKDTSTASSKSKDKEKAAPSAKPVPSKKSAKKAPAAEPSDDYLADLDLPPSDEEEYETIARAEEPEEETKKPEVLCPAVDVRRTALSASICRDACIYKLLRHQHQDTILASCQSVWWYDA